MNYVKDYNFLGIESKQIPCIEGEGAPNENTAGAVGCLYMDTSTALKNLYKCIGITNGKCTWVPLIDGTQFGALDESDPLPADVLQTIYRFHYYSSFAGAIEDINNGTVGVNADSKYGEAAVGIYLAHDKPVAVLLSDSAVTSNLTIAADMTLKLNGKSILVASGTNISVSGCNATIDGRIDGSKIYKKVETDTGVTESVISIKSGGMLKVIGGSIENDVHSGTKSVFAIGVNSNTVFIATDCKISAANILGTGTVWAVRSNANSKAHFKNCKVYADSTIGSGSAWTNSGNDALAVDSLFYGDGVAVGATNGAGGSMVLDNCETYGSPAGMENGGQLYINGGTYRGVRYGGIYFMNFDQTVYVENATIASARYEGKHKDIYAYLRNGENGYESQYDVAAVYVGNSGSLPDGTSGPYCNVKVYLDNCDIIGGKYNSIALRGYSGETNNAVYLSNCKFSGDNKTIRIDNDTHKVYLGFGNNITAEDTSLPEAVVVTNEIYVKEDEQ